MKWTEEQNDAIVSGGNNILVSAGAGAGKTAVLVERIKKQVIDEKIGITKILVVTFTNAAALEMKEKIRAAIFSELERLEDDETDKREYLSEQLRSFGNTSISTFHSFALSVIREYYYLCDLSPNFKVAEQDSTELLEQEALDLIFEKEYREKRKEFYEFNEKYSSGKNNYGARTAISDTYKFIRSLPNPMEWLANKADSPSMKTVSAMIKPIILRKLEVAIYYMARAMEMTGNGDTPETNNNYMTVFNELESLKELFEDHKLFLDEKSYDAVGERLSEISFSYLIKRSESKLLESYKESIKECTEAAKNQIEKLISDFFSYSYEEYEKTILRTNKDLAELKYLVEEFDKIFAGLKRQENIIDFSDIEHMALKILANNDIAKEYRNKFEYIYIDEYQDSNLVQEEIVNSIKRSDNLFMVGDVKQSIYKFRLAEPEIFIKKMEDYQGDNKKGKIINLRTNFRSKDPILSSVNYFFSKIMNSPQSGLSYGERESLITGQKNHSEYNFPPELYQVKIPASKDDTFDHIDDEIKSLKSVEIDAKLTAEIIKKNIGKKYHNGKTDEVKNLEARDIVILLRAVSGRADIYRKALEEADIPAFIEESEGYFDTIEIQVFINLLKVIDNRNQDIPLISVLISPIFNFSVEELAAIRIFKNRGSYFESMYEYEKAGDNKELREKIVDFFKCIDKWKKDAMFMTLEAFILKLYEESGYYTYVSALPMGEKRKKNLDLLAVRGRNFQEIAISGIYGFLSYINMIKKKRINIPQATAVKETENVVRIMTIHKSKGLEFPMVIVAGMGTRIGGMQNMGACTFHNELGIGIRPNDVISKAMADNLMYKIIESKNFYEGLAEEQRVLYVALTRARDKLIMVGSSKKSLDYGKMSDDFSVETEVGNSYLSWISPLMLENPNGKTYKMNLENLDFLCKEEKEDIKVNINKKELLEKLEKEALSEEKDEKYNEISEKLAYVYESEEQSIKSRYAVTELIKTGLRKNLKMTESDWNSFGNINLHKSKMSAAEKGILVHLILELISFKNVYEDITEKKLTIEQSVKNRVATLVNKGQIEESKLGEISLKAVEAFFETEAGKLILSGYEKENEMILYKERSFVFKKFLEEENQEITIIGKIDCLFNINGKWYIVDYKTDMVNKNNPEAEKARLCKEYREQMKLYKEAIEDCFREKVAEVHLILLSLKESVKVL